MDNLAVAHKNTQRPAICKQWVARRHAQEFKDAAPARLLPPSMGNAACGVGFAALEWAPPHTLLFIAFLLDVHGLFVDFPGCVWPNGVFAL